jgi:hypothetical protein
MVLPPGAALTPMASKIFLSFFNGMSSAKNHDPAM